MKYRKKIWLLLIIMAFVFILMSVAGNKAEKIKTDNKNLPYQVVKNWNSINKKLK